MGKVAVVTGASRGIGAATAIRLAADGYDICINYLSNEDAANQISESVKTYGVNAVCVQADISLEADVERLFNKVDKKLGMISVLVNNAGILFQQSQLVDINVERIHRIFQTNVIGTFSCCKQAVQRMSTKRKGCGGVIVNISSAAAKTGSPGEYIDYAASKGAIDTLTVGLAKEVAAEGIRVNCVRPGLIYTDIHQSGGEPDRVNRIKNSLPLQRGGQPDEVAAAISWLVSDQSGYTTGSFIDVSGGV